MKNNFQKSDIRRLVLYFAVVLFWGFNVPGLIAPVVRFPYWTDPLFWTAGVVIYKILEQSGHFFAENTGKVTNVMLHHALYFGVMGITLFPIIEYTLLPKRNALFAFIGFSLLVLGGYLRYIALKILGRCFSTHIEIYGHHRLVQDHLYAVIRHPGYLGSICLGVGSILAVSAWYSTIFFVLYFLPVLIARVYFEERRLSEELPGYLEYCKRTKRFIPYLF